VRLGLPTGVDTPLGKRLAALTFLRLGVLTLLLIIIEVYYLRSLPFGGYSTVVGVATVGFAFLLSAAYTAMLRSGRWLSRVAFAQLATDQLTWTAVVYISGGVTSGSTSLYGLTCLSGAVLIGTSGAAWAAGWGCVSYLALCALFANGTIPPPPDQPVGAYVVAGSAMVYPAFSTVVATGLVASLASYLAERLRTFGGRLEEATKRVEEVERLAALGRLSAALAHEIRNPLGSIRGSIELLRTGGELPSEDERLCFIIEREAERLNDLVTDMIDLSRPRAPERQKIDVADTARNVVELACGSARGQDMTILYRGPEALMIDADPSQMRQMLWNLVRNAMQASQDGAEVRVIIEEQKQNEGAVMRVEDDGSGIPESKRNHIFDAFFTTRAHGVGIGLAVVKRITDDHEFSIDVESTRDSGTTFSVRIPKAALVAAIALALIGCGGGQKRVDRDIWWADDATQPVASASPPSGPGGPALPTSNSAAGGSGAAPPVIATFRNTYYDFPQEPAISSGETRDLFAADCKPIRVVPRSFHDSLCVQGSGRLATGETVSFARRDCECAAICPRTDQKICFDVLDKQQFPWGRGAAGTAITPLRSVAVDVKEIPLGTVLYIPEYHGLRGPDGRSHDGCFIAEDRGLKVVGKHIDVFTGNPATTKSWNESVPSNMGVRVILSASRCAHLAPRKAPSAE
jgi:two-component system, NtrC family, sensor histidine kinase HydH